MPDLDRRRFLAAGFGLGAIGLLVTACGGQDAPTGGTPTDGAAAFPRTVTHKYGRTEIPTAPQRVVTVGLSDADYVLALGLVPAALTDWYGDYPDGVWPWAEEALGDGAPEVMPRNGDQLNFELIRTFRPDLIMGMYTGMKESDYDTLSGICPTVAQSGAFPDYGMTWQATAALIGDALGRPEQARALVEAIEARFATAREDNPQFVGKTAVVAEKFDTYVVRGGTDPRTRFLTDLGFVLPPDIATLTEGTDAAPVSAEQLSLLDRDLLVWNAGFTPELVEELADSDQYQALAVVRAGHDLILAGEPLSGALTWSTVLSLPLALDQLVPQLARTLGG